jgi:hypothetical protein
LTAISFPATNHLHRWLAAAEIQKLPSFSMTGATSIGSRTVLTLDFDKPDNNGGTWSVRHYFVSRVCGELWNKPAARHDRSVRPNSENLCRGGDAFVT